MPALSRAQRPGSNSAKILEWDEGLVGEVISTGLKDKMLERHNVHKRVCFDTELGQSFVITIVDSVSCVLEKFCSFLGETGAGLDCGCCVSFASPLPTLRTAHAHRVFIGVRGRLSPRPRPWSGLASGDKDGGLCPSSAPAPPALLLRFLPPFFIPAMHLINCCAAAERVESSGRPGLKMAALWVRLGAAETLLLRRSRLRPDSSPRQARPGGGNEDLSLFSLSHSLTSGRIASFFLSPHVLIKKTAQIFGRPGMRGLAFPRVREAGRKGAK